MAAAAALLILATLPRADRLQDFVAKLREALAVAGCVRASVSMRREARPDAPVVIEVRCLDGDGGDEGWP